MKVTFEGTEDEIRSIFNTVVFLNMPKYSEKTMHTLTKDEIPSKNGL